MLTPRTLEILQIMDRDNEELVVDRLSVWVGEERTSVSVVTSLLRCLAISDVSDSDGIQRYTVNSAGRAILKEPKLADEIVAAVLAGQNFTIVDGKIAPVDDLKFS